MPDSSLVPDSFESGTSGVRGSWSDIDETVATPDDLDFIEVADISEMLLRLSDPTEAGDLTGASITIRARVHQLGSGSRRLYAVITDSDDGFLSDPVLVATLTPSDDSFDNYTVALSNLTSTLADDWADAKLQLFVVQDVLEDASSGTLYSANNAPLLPS